MPRGVFHSLGTTPYESSWRGFARVETRPQHPPWRTRTRASSSARAERRPSAFDGMSHSPLHAMYGAPATTNGVGSERQRLLAEVVGESPDPPREPLSRGARVRWRRGALCLARQRASDGEFLNCSPPSRKLQTKLGLVIPGYVFICGFAWANSLPERDARLGKSAAGA